MDDRSRLESVAVDRNLTDAMSNEKKLFCFSIFNYYREYRERVYRESIERESIEREYRESIEREYRERV